MAAATSLPAGFHEQPPNVAACSRFCLLGEYNLFGWRGLCGAAPNPARRIESTEWLAFPSRVRVVVAGFVWSGLCTRLGSDGANWLLQVTMLGTGARHVASGRRLGMHRDALGAEKDVRVDGKRGRFGFQKIFNGQRKQTMRKKQHARNEHTQKHTKHNSLYFL